MNDTLVRFQSVVEGFAAVRATSADARLDRMREVVGDFGVLFADRPPSFNTLAAIGIGPDEVTHSRILAWLLDPRAGHGQGPLFLHLLAIPLHLRIGLDTGHRYLVRREFPGVEAIVDICVCQPEQFIIFIEHKLLADEGPEQVDREWRDIQRVGEANGVPVERRYAIFLTPDGRPPSSGDPSHWLCLSYRSLINVFRVCVSELGDRKVSDLLSDWLDLLYQWSDD